MSSTLLLIVITDNSIERAAITDVKDKAEKREDTERNQLKVLLTRRVDGPVLYRLSSITYLHIQKKRIY